MTRRTNCHRRAGLSLEQRVWRLLRREPDGWSPRRLAERMDLDALAAGTALRRLVAKGCATRTGATHSLRYWATETRPEDWRGTTPGSLRALQQHGPVRRSRAPKKGTPRRLRSQCALVEVWGL